MIFLTLWRKVTTFPRNIKEAALKKQSGFFVCLCLAGQAFFLMLLPLCIFGGQALYPWRLEDVDDEGCDEDDKTIDDGNHHALVSAHQDRRKYITIRLREVANLIVTENAEQDSRNKSEESYPPHPRRCFPCSPS